jgi:hypothetical protein
VILSCFIHNQMKSKLRFREGWITLQKGFEFAELSKPLEKMTILYAYSEKPIIEYELSDEGREKLEEFNILSGKSIFAGGRSAYVKRYGEEQDAFDMRMVEEFDKIYKEFETEERYIGQVVQCVVEDVMCRFYPDEYNITGRDTFEHILTSDDFTMDIENDVPFQLAEIKLKLFYIMSRGIDESMAKRMASAGMKDSVIFRPGPGVLQMFCRQWDILDKDMRELIYGPDPEIKHEPPTWVTLRSNR